MNTDFITYDTILDKAYEYASSKKVNPFKRAAFANSVAYLCTGMSGGYGGPSIREHLVSRMVFGQMAMYLSDGLAAYEVSKVYPRPGDWFYDQAVNFCQELIFPQIQDLPEEVQNIVFQVKEQEYCFDNDPDDL